MLNKPFGFYQQPFVNATGGDIVATSGSYRIHTFNSTRTLTIQAAPADAEIQLMIVAGGGTGQWGDQNQVSAGGGGGGVIYSGSFSNFTTGD
jgi:hypothetical protein